MWSAGQDCNLWPTAKQTCFSERKPSTKTQEAKDQPSGPGGSWHWPQGGAALSPLPWMGQGLHMFNIVFENKQLASTAFQGCDKHGETASIYISIRSDGCCTDWPPALVTSWLFPSGIRNSECEYTRLVGMSESCTGLMMLLVKGGVTGVVVMGIWQNFPVKFGGQRQRLVCRQTPPFLQSRGQRTVETHSTSTTTVCTFIALNDFYFTSPRKNYSIWFQTESDYKNLTHACEHPSTQTNTHTQRLVLLSRRALS